MNEIAQDASSVGNALKTISMRIRAMDEETGEFDDTLQTISGDIYEFDLSGGPYFIPKSITSNKKYDKSYTNTDSTKGIRKLLVNGCFFDGSGAGVGLFNPNAVSSYSTPFYCFFTITDLD